MQGTELHKTIDAAWENRGSVNADTRGDVRDSVQEILNLLDTGRLRVASRDESGWHVHEWIKKAILLSFRLNPSAVVAGGPGVGENQSNWYDKVPSKFSGWIEKDYTDAGIRAVPGCFVRHGSFIAKDAVIMPSFINIGAYVGEGTMIDSFATVGSCAQVGAGCHISSNAGLGGVLEPLQASPVIIEDNCFIGAQSEIAEGVHVEEGCVIGMGVCISATTKIVDRETGAIYQGRVPAYSVVVSGTLPGKTRKDGSVAPSLYAAIIVKTVDAQTRSKTSLNDLLRDA